jgi:1,4-alpha-glucan branching enzyme
VTERAAWDPTLGAVVEGGLRTAFRVWAPTTKAVDLVLAHPGGTREHRTLAPDAVGVFT